MARMEELLDERLEESKYELYEILKILVERYWCNQEEDYTKGFISCITPTEIPYHWKRARMVVEHIKEETANVGS